MASNEIMVAEMLDRPIAIAPPNLAVLRRQDEDGSDLRPVPPLLAEPQTSPEPGIGRALDLPTIGNRIWPS